MFEAKKNLRKISQVLLHAYFKFSMSRLSQYRLSALKSISKGNFCGHIIDCHVSKVITFPFTITNVD